MGVLASQTVRDMVILSDSCALVLMIARPAIFKSETRVALLHAAALIERHQRFTTQLIPADTGVPGNTIAGKAAEETRMLPGSINYANGPLETYREL